MKPEDIKRNVAYTITSRDYRDGQGNPNYSIFVAARDGQLLGCGINWSKIVINSVENLVSWSFCEQDYILRESNVKEIEELNEIFLKNDIISYERIPVTSEVDNLINTLSEYINKHDES